MRRGTASVRRCPGCKKKFRCMSYQPEEYSCSTCQTNQMFSRKKTTTDTSFILQQATRHK